MAVRITDLTDEQRRVIEQARRLLSPHFPGETLKLYVPQRLIDAKLEREQRVRDALRAGLKPREIASREGVSDRYVRALRGRFGTVHP